MKLFAITLEKQYLSLVNGDEPIAELYDENYFIYEIGTDFSSKLPFVKLNPGYQAHCLME